jgi:hypothetical protein
MFWFLQTAERNVYRKLVRLQLGYTPRISQSKANRSQALDILFI